MRLHKSSCFALSGVVIVSGIANEVCAQEPEMLSDRAYEQAMTHEVQALTDTALRSEEQARRLCDDFMDRIVAEKAEEAFVLVKPYFPISKDRFDRLQEETQRQLRLAHQQFGHPRGYRQVERKLLGETLLRYRYIEKFDLDLLLWEFVLYKPKDAWLVNGLGFEDEIQSLFD